MGLTTGHVLQNRYRVAKLLGQGGMGAVYRAWDLRLNIPVALKEMIPQPGLAADALAQLRQQFEQEASILARLNHPHLVRVIDFFDEGGNSYLAMDFVEGESLADRMKREGALPESQVLAWGRQLLDALDYCHQQGVLHRDIKPQNVIIRPDGKAVLVDFGLVKLWDPSDPRTKTAMRGMGTPEYAPPEQYETAAGHTAPASDIYSLGATLYHALAGQAPPTATLRMADPTQYIPLREVAPHVSPETEAAIERAMDLVRAERWESAEAMTAALGGHTPPPHKPPPRPAIIPRREATKVMADAQSAALAPQRSITRRQFLLGALIAGGAVVGCGTAAAVGGLIATNGQWFSAPKPTQTPAQAKAEPTDKPQPTDKPGPTDKPPTPEPRPTEAPAEPVPIRWFIGLGTGALDEQLDVEEAWIEDFNARQGEIDLSLEVSPNETATEVLMTKIAAGDPPDVCGPVGVRGVSQLPGLWLDMEEYLDPFTKVYDLTDIHPGVANVWRVTGLGLVGLPVSAFPSALYFNRDAFDEAGLVYPPQTYGQDYQGSEWSIDLLQEIAMALTLDTNGRDAQNSRFSPTNIIRFGFVHQWTDSRGWATFFGAGSFVASDGKTAQCPDHWREAFRWYHRAMWESSFAPNGPYTSSDLLAGHPFGSGNVAIAHCHLWLTCCVDGIPNWDYACIPSYNGETTAKLHTDAIGVINHTAHPEMAVHAASAIAVSEDLIATWIEPFGLPALRSLHDKYLARLDERFPQGVNWQTIIDGLNYTDSPNHESWMPNFTQADDRILAFQGELETNGNLDVEDEIDALIADLQDIFAA
jgi:multiple sugar transport system substrate-binding protein